MSREQGVKVNAAGHSVRGGKGRTGVVGKQIKGREEPLAWCRDSNGGTQRAVSPSGHNRVHPHYPWHGVGSEGVTDVQKRQEKNSQWMFGKDRRELQEQVTYT